ncbi:MAG: archaellin/type IV pilin N-terminal domain-containing protein [Salinigranum sp.]
MFQKETDDRGQVGIGTLIVFIAMVLVAAIAAGVLVNTAGFLQATASQAGQQSVNKVTNRLDVVSVHGIVNKTADGGMAVDQINLTVRLAAGSGSVSLRDTTIKYLSDQKATTLTYDPSNQNDTKWDGSYANVQNGINSSEFIANVHEDGGDNSFPVLNAQADRYEITLNTSVIEGSGVDGTSTGETVKLDLTSRTGGTTQVILTMPQQLAGKHDGDPVAL